RQVLNLGHTLGHVLEACRDVSHGEAVGQGLYFSLKWSLQRGMISLKDYFNCVELLNGRLHIQCWLEGKVRYQPMTIGEFQQALTHDKKRLSRDQIQFVFLRKWGQPVMKQVSPAEILREARRQGWVR